MTKNSMRMCRIAEAEDAELLCAEKHGKDDENDDANGNLHADLRQRDRRDAEKCADDVHEKHSLALRETEV